MACVAPNEARSADTTSAGAPKQRSRRQSSRNGQKEPTAQQATYKFVLSTGEPKAVSGESRKALRSHVMRDVFQQRRSAREDASRHISANTVISQQSLKGRFRLRGNDGSNKITGAEVDERELEQEQHTATRDTGEGRNNDRPGLQGFDIHPSTETGLSTPMIATASAFQRRTDRQLDPFDTLPVRSTPRVETLLYHWMTVFNLNSIAMHTIPGWWFHFAFSDAAVLHSVLYNIAMHCGAYYKLSLTNDVHQHKGEAIKLINNKLRDTTQQVTVGLIGAISSLITYENLWGSYDLAATHLTSLERMIAMRDDISLPAYDPLMRGIVWAAYHCAAAQRTVPHTRFNPLLCDAVFPIELVREASMVASDDLPKLRSMDIRIFEVLCSFQVLATACDTKWVSAVDRTLVSNTLHDLEYQLTCIAYDLKSKSGATSVDSNLPDSVVEALVAAAHAFIYAGLRKVPLVAKIFDIFIGRIIDALSHESDFASHWREQGTLQAALWVLVVGAIIANERLEYFWFEERVARLLQELGIERLEDFQLILKGFAWTEPFCASACSAIWLASGTTRGIAGGKSTASAGRSVPGVSEPSPE